MIEKSRSNLAPLYTFDPRAFQGSAEYPQPVCNVILGAALLYNDIKDSISVINILSKNQPTSKPGINAEWGEFTGRDLHLLRHHVGLVWELFEFIEANIDIINSEVFNSVVKQMSGSARSAWHELVGASMSKDTSGSIGKIFLRIRHKMTFHYDAEEIMRGYNSHFFDEERIKQQAFISTGSDMAQSRYYFADGAVQNYINLMLGDMKKEAFQNEIIDVTHKINEAFRELIARFIQKRGFAYTQYRSTESNAQ